MNKILNALSVFVIALLALSVASAVTLEEVKLDGDELDVKNGINFLDVERGDESTVRVEVLGNNDSDLDDIQIDLAIRGYEHGDVESLYVSSDVFKLKANATHRETLRFKFPKRLEADKYTLTVTVAGRSGILASKLYEFDVSGKRHDVAIEDVILSPSVVQAGRAVIATVRVENFGERDEEGVKASIEIPSLNIKDAKYVDEVEEDEEVTSEELFLRIPPCTPSGDYRATVSLTFNDGYDTTSKDYTITVVDGNLCEAGDAPVQPTESAGKTIITVIGEAQDVVKGTTGAVYPITLTNTGSSAKTYTISATVGDWASVRFSPSNVVVLNAGESKAVFAHIASTDKAQVGEQVFSLAVKSGETTLKELIMRANVLPGQSTTAAPAEDGYSKVKRGLEVGLVVLVVLLVILGLVIGFNRLKESNDDEPGDGQTYY